VGTKNYNNFSRTVRQRMSRYGITLDIIQKDLKKIGVNTSIPTLWRVVNTVTNKCDHHVYQGISEVLMLGDTPMLNYFRHWEFLIDDRLNGNKTED
jgi:hypothetical protein